MILISNKNLIVKKILLSRAGSVLPMILVLGAVGLVSMLALMQYINPLASSYSRNTEMMTYRVAMDGLLDYTIGAVKQNKCFNGTMLWVECTDLTSPYNTERLLMSSESLEKIAMSNTVPIPATPLSQNLILNQMEFNFEILSPTSPITAAHPISAIIEPIKFKSKLGTYSPIHSIKNIKVTLSRISSAEIPQNDNFTLLKFRVVLTPSDAVTFFNSAELSSESIVVFTPRKLSGNALVLANNLDLTGSGTTNATNSVIPTFSSIASGGKGLRFESPVVLNSDVILPSPTGTAYSPVAFLEKVYLGKNLYTSSVLEANLAKPVKPGNPSERYYSQMSRMYGFMNGIDLDPFPDEGLNYLFDVASPSTGNTDLNRCLARSQALTDKTVTRESRLYAGYLGETGTVANKKFSFVLSLGQINFFVPQSTPAGATIGADVKSSNMSAVVPAVSNVVLTDAGINSDFPIARVTVKMNNFTHPALPGWTASDEFYASANLSRDGTLTIPLTGGASIVVKTSPMEINDRVQSSELMLDVEFFNQGAIALALPDRPVTTCPGQAWTPILADCPTGSWTQYPMQSWEPPRVTVDIEAFDVAYRNGESQRLLFVNAPPDREGSAAHPFFGSMKKHQFVFARNIGDSNFTLRSGSIPVSTAAVRTWVECIGNDAIPGGVPNCTYPADAGMRLPDNPYWPVNQEELHKPLGTATDLETLYDQCKVTAPPGSAYSPSFGALAWYYSAANAPGLDETSKKEVIRHAWGFVPGYSGAEALGPPGSTDQGLIAEMTFDANAALLSATETPVFGVQSRVQRCIVKSTANFVAGLYTCDEFIIEDRTTPLRIIGTVIAGRLSIHPNAVYHGIRWSSVFNASSMYELQRAGILNSLASCTLPQLPHWIPVKTAAQEDQLGFCLPGYLTNQVDPFNWTMVDPDCIRNPDPANNVSMVCKRHPRRYVVKEITRSYTP